MKSYKVTCVDQTGKTIKDVIPAENESELLATIKSQGNFLVQYEEVQHIAKHRGKLSINALLVFTYQLSAMLSADVSLVDALRMVQNRVLKDADRRIYRNLYEEVQKGNSLSSAMMEQGGAFDALLVSMVRSGEASGSIGDSLQTMADQYDRDKKINQRIRTASMYPIVLLVVSILVVLALVTFVLPGIMNAFPATDVPFLTQILMGLSNFVIHRWYFLVIIVAGLVLGGYLALNTRSSRVVIDRWILHLPIVGKLLKIIYSARCARSFASLYNHGINALEMISLTKGVIGNTYLEDAFDQLYISVSRGESLSRSIDEIGEFDPMLASMIQVGEEIGDLERILNKTADYFDQEAESALTRLISLIEPVMVVWMGIMIALIVISILQPMFQMYEQI